MTERPETRPTPVGVYGRSSSIGVSRAEVIAIVLSVVWLGAAAIFFLSMDGSGDDVGALTTAMVVLAVVLPLAMFWLAVAAARTGRMLRAENARLQDAVDAIRESYASGEVPAAPAAGGRESITQKLDEIAAAQRKTETALATFQSSRTSESPKRELPVAPVPEVEDQADLPLEVVADDETVTLPKSTLIRALNFPETAEDEEGFSALRQALRDRMTANLVQAAQDVLTLLSQDGIYMDDLRPDMARPELWRRFAQGERGRVVAALGGIRDRSSLALTAGRMRQDPIFRDAAHHFLRRFDTMLQEFETSATDQEISSLAETRTARAFMLLGRVAGVFT